MTGEDKTIVNIDKSKSASISMLRIVATIVVIFSHAFSTLTENTDMFALTGHQRLFLEVLINLVKWPVPCFFMITGVLLLNQEKPISVRDCIFKYAKRMLLALFIFGVPLAILEIIFESHTLSVFMLWEAVLRVINGKSFGHLWYLYTLIGIYLALPLLRLLTRSLILLEYALAILFVFDFCIPFLNDMLGLTIAFTLPVGTYAIFYVLLGKYLNDEKPRILNSVGVLVATIVVCVLVDVAACLAGKAAPIMAYTSPVNAALTISIYALFAKIRIVSSKRMWRVDRLCFGVYLIHPVFIHFTYKFLKLTPTQFSMYPIMLILFGIVFTAASFFGSWVMSLIKPLKKYAL